MDTIGNQKKESEKYVAKLLKGKFSTIVSFNDIVSSIPNLELELLEEEMEQIKDTFLSKNGEVNEKVGKKFLLGEASEIYDLLSNIIVKSKSLLESSMVLHEQNHIRRLLKLENDINNTRDMAEFSLVVDAASLDDMDQYVLKEMVEKLPSFIQSLLNLGSIYNTGYISYESTPFPSKVPEVKTFLPEFCRTLFDLPLPFSVGVIIGSIVDTIATLVQPEKPVPYVVDIVEELIDCFKNPENYYSKVKQGEITQATVGQMFCYCMPGYALDFALMLFDDLESMTYSEQINYKKSFGIIDDNTDLLQLCSTYIKLGYMIQGSNT